VYQKNFLALLRSGYRIFLAIKPSNHSQNEAAETLAPLDSVSDRASITQVLTFCKNTFPLDEDISIDIEFD
jgi:hypothetical protein